MRILRRMLDKLRPRFEKGGKSEKFSPLYEAVDTFFYTPGNVTQHPPHIRDGIDLKRYMGLVVIALLPCTFMALWNTGFQANNTIHNRQIGQLLVDSEAITSAELVAVMHESVGRPIEETVVDIVVQQRMEAAIDDDPSLMPAEIKTRIRPELTDKVQAVTAELDPDTKPDPATISNPQARFDWPDWQTRLMQWLGIDFDPRCFWANVFYGVLYFLPVYFVTVLVGGFWEVLFAIVRRREITEAFLVISLIFPLILPPTVPLWQVALGISFGVVFGKEVFGGTGRNFLNPAATAWAFLFFAYPTYHIGESIWTAAAVDGFSGATPLTALSGISEVTGTVNSLNVSWWQAFFGTIPGAMGETSTLACLLGAAILIVTGIGSWKIMLSMTLGAVATAIAFNAFGSNAAVMHTLAPHWHLVLGGFAFGAVFMATDPVSASMTSTGQWWYGGLIGVMAVVIRGANMRFPEGVMLAILLGNVFAPLIDYFVLQANIKRRLARNAV